MRCRQAGAEGRGLIEWGRLPNGNGNVAVPRSNADVGGVGRRSFIGGAKIAKVPPHLHNPTPGFPVVITRLHKPRTGAASRFGVRRSAACSRPVCPGSEGRCSRPGRWPFPTTHDRGKGSRPHLHIRYGLVAPLERALSPSPISPRMPACASSHHVMRGSRFGREWRVSPCRCAVK